MILLSTAYAGNVQYFSKLLGGEKCIVERYDSYVKQSYRNRCDILSANGVISLSIPIVKTHGEKTLVKDTRIDYSMDWPTRHWRGIVSAYRNSAYFDYYEDLLAPCYVSRPRFLLDFNDELLHKLLVCLEAEDADYVYSDRYMTDGPGIRDYRNSLSPKAALQREDAQFEPVPYYQVFSEKFSFIPNLSVMDLLFCEGPHAREIIKRSIVEL